MHGEHWCQTTTVWNHHVQQEILKNAFPSPNFQVPTVLIFMHTLAVELVRTFQSQVMFHFSTFLLSLWKIDWKKDRNILKILKMNICIVFLISKGYYILCFLQQEHKTNNITDCWTHEIGRTPSFLKENFQGSLFKYLPESTEERYFTQY